MSGVTSTIHDSGRVYLFDRNALPKNFIESGMKLTTDGLNAIVGTGSCDIGGKYHELTEATSIAIPQRATCLLYAAKSDLADTPTLGYFQAAFPAADSGTVCRYLINGDASIASSGGTGGGVLTKTGTVTQVDGWIGYGGQGDGSTGYYTSANSTGFPTGTAARQLDILLTCVGTGHANIPHLAGYGALSASQYFSLGLDATNQLTVQGHTATYYSGFTLDAGKTYFASLTYDGTTVYLWVNGNLVYSVASSLNTGAGALTIFKSAFGAYYSGCAIHYVEIRNTLRTAAQNAAISNTLLLPCRYYTSETANTYTDVRAVLPADTISLGRTRTSSAAITEARMEYQDGRREGAWGRNRMAFLGWKNFAGMNIPYAYNLPFGTPIYKITKIVATDNISNPSRYTIQTPAYYNYYSSGFYGVFIVDHANTSEYLKIAGQGNLMYFGSNKTSGFYIGVWAEVME